MELLQTALLLDRATVGRFVALLKEAEAVVAGPFLLLHCSQSQVWHPRTRAEVFALACVANRFELPLPRLALELIGNLLQFQPLLDSWRQRAINIDVYVSHSFRQQLDLSQFGWACGSTQDRRDVYDAPTPIVVHWIDTSIYVGDSRDGVRHFVNDALGADLFVGEFFEAKKVPMVVSLGLTECGEESTEPLANKLERARSQLMNLAAQLDSWRFVCENQEDVTTMLESL